MKHLKKFNESKRNDGKVLSEYKILDSVYKIVEVDEPMGGEGTKVLDFYKNDKVETIEDEFEKFCDMYRKYKIDSNVFYQFLKLNDKWNKLCNNIKK